MMARWIGGVGETGGRVERPTIGLMLSETAWSEELAVGLVHQRSIEERFPLSERVYEKKTRIWGPSGHRSVLTPI